MKILISTIGSRGDVQPLLALAQQLLALGQAPCVCAPPNFREWVESYGVGFVPIGPDVKQLARNNPSSKPPRPTKARRAQLAEYTVREQFRVLGEAARGSGLLIGGGALQIALPSIAEALGIPYVYVAYCPATLPSPDHPPAKMDVHYPSWLPAPINRLLWRRDARGWNRLFGTALNDQRAKVGLPPVPHVRRYVFGDRPWLAADPALAPTADSPGMHIVQTGSWILRDETPLSPAIDRFLQSGDAPVYFGFGSMREEKHTGAMLIEGARRIGRRSVILRGWADLGSSPLGDDCLVIEDVDHDTLFPRMAAIVHHGGAGTTDAAARSGRPQVAVPHHYDQFYWAGRVKTLGIGAADFTRRELTADKLAKSLESCLRRATAERASSFAKRMTEDGARTAAQRLIDGGP